MDSTRDYTTVKLASSVARNCCTLLRTFAHIFEAFLEIWYGQQLDPGEKGCVRFLLLHNEMSFSGAEASKVTK